MNCIIVDDEPIAQDILKNFVEKVDFLRLNGVYDNATEAFNSIQKGEVELVFLDINMPGIDGMAFAKILPKHIKIIFTTAYREYAVEGFDLHAMDYLLKPISFERFLKAVNRVREALGSITTGGDEIDRKFVFVRVDRKMEKLAFDEIMYIESYADYLKIHTATGLIVVRETLSNFEEKLPNDHFIRVHRSYIARLDAISSYTHEQIEVNKNSLPISRSYKEKVLETLQRFE
ncbi:MAG: DNA-binding response regulator [Cytophagaceae bacterium]|nr:DNA-binding response regulator [Cytophagaceae bacterium]|tara:strand:+ start:7793 stop:8488 length:696 start_codon:yes stop_codon:yes gene_type:complete